MTKETTSTTSADGTLVLTTDAPTAVVVFVHGLGDGYHSFAGWIAMLAEMLPHVKFVFPLATVEPVTVNGGRCMPSWFDIVSLKDADDDYAAGIEDSAERLVQLIDKEIDGGIPASRIVLGGISQGAATTLFTGFQIAFPLAGIFCLSGFIPKMNTFAVTQATRNVPLLMCHGEADKVVSFAWGTRAKQRLQSLGVSDVEWHAYPLLGHSMSIDEVTDMENWLRRVLPPV